MKKNEIEILSASVLRVEEDDDFLYDDIQYIVTYKIDDKEDSSKIWNFEIDTRSLGWRRVRSSMNANGEERRACYNSTKYFSTKILDNSDLREELLDKIEDFLIDNEIKYQIHRVSFYP